GGDAPSLEGDMVPLSESLVSGDGLEQRHAAVVLEAARHRLQPRPLPLTDLEEPQHVVRALEVLTGEEEVPAEVARQGRMRDAEEEMARLARGDAVLVEAVLL